MASSLYYLELHFHFWKLSRECLNLSVTWCTNILYCQSQSQQINTETDCIQLSRIGKQNSFILNELWFRNTWGMVLLFSPCHYSRGNLEVHSVHRCSCNCWETHARFSRKLRLPRDGKEAWARWNCNPVGENKMLVHEICKEDDVRATFYRPEEAEMLDETNIETSVRYILMSWVAATHSHTSVRSHCRLPIFMFTWCAWPPESLCKILHPSSFYQT